MNEQTNKWLVDKANLPVSLAAGIVHPDQAVFTHFYSRSFATTLKENAWAELLEVAREIARREMPVTRLRWQFQNAFVFGTVRGDGACAFVVTSRSVPKEDAVFLENLLVEFQHV